jgi:hypothetical protein
MDNQRLANFYVGLEAIQGFTQSRRDLNFDTGISDTQPRLDMLFGIRAGWVIHLYSREPQLYYSN